MGWGKLDFPNTLIDFGSKNLFDLVDKSRSWISVGGGFDHSHILLQVF